ncbi:MAG: 16S rRNA (cytosine(1402)-N(4))-methyltransferase RsmH [Gammaproteobacteria bacterium]|nr:16S rRNA (cytosine(1402)-N(4))-methyltransferase RsmH [Gammaproteobacteria bacterium]
MEISVHHAPVLLEEVIHALAIKPDGVYVDGTFGRGGHTRAILERLSDQGRLFAIDKDPDAIKAAQTLCATDKRFQILQGSFVELKGWVQELELLGKVDGILLDLGVSSPQLDKAQRGFSFTKEGPLDMRMNPQKGQDAASFIATVKEADLSNILKEYGEERFAKRIARAIVTARKKEPICTTKQLAEIVKRANPRWERRIHPATKTFLAIRIFINQEFEELRIVLQHSLEILKAQGRLVVISFHSTEDRIVKRFMRDQSRGLGLPESFLRDDQKPRLRKIGKAIKPSQEEVKRNPRARSAMLRIAEKIN